jgi:hypothetical protein
MAYAQDRLPLLWGSRIESDADSDAQAEQAVQRWKLKNS